MSFIICGGAGFIGVNFVSKICKSNNEIFIIDNFKNGSLNWIKLFSLKDKVKVIECDLSDLKATKSVFKKITMELSSEPQLWHFAANSDIPLGVEDPEVDLKDTFMTTYNLLKICKEFRIKIFNFASSSAVYGDHGTEALNEKTGPLMPISNYGAMKLASEAQCFAALESFLERLIIFRFPNVVGIPATHGVLLDFINNLIKDPSKLNVLGDGTQQKSYLHVSDLVNGMLHISNKKIDKSENPIFNIGPNNDFVSVKWIAEETVKLVSPEAKIIYGKDNRGWIGDVPKFSYDTLKANKTGWVPLLNSKEAIQKAIKEIKEFKTNV